MNIVVLDGHTLNPGDLSWDELAALGDCKIYDRTPPGLVRERAAGAELVFTNKTVLDAGIIADLPALRFIGVLATGYNVVDVEAAQSRGIPVCNVPSYGTDSVGQMVMAHLLNLTQRVADHAGAVREGQWTDCADFCFWNAPLVELMGKKMGLVGYGRIGKSVARMAAAFGMKILAYSRREGRSEEGVQFVDLDTLFSDCDVVSLHCPLTADNANLVDAHRLAQMKPTALLINTSRGPLVDAHALADALNEGRLAGAGIDVLPSEPPEAENPLFSAKNCYITPHIAWATIEARTRLMDTAVANAKAFLDGSPTNVVT